MNKKHLAFTLIELLVVIAIVGILSGLIIVGMSSSIQQATVAKAQVFSTSLRDSLLMNLVAEWKLDQIDVPNSNQTPDSWSNNNCTLNGAGGLPVLQTANCIYDKCISFDGVDDYIDCGDADSLHNITNAITVSYWVYINAYPPSNYSLMVSKGYAPSSGRSWSAGLTTTGSGYFFIRRADNSDYTYAETSGWTALPLRKWVYMTHVFDGSRTYGATYQNGIIDKERTTMPTAAIYVSAYSVLLGSGSAAGRYFNGVLDDVRIYNAAIPSSQIKEQYFSSINRLLAKGGITESDYQKRLSDNNL